MHRTLRRGALVVLAAATTATSLSTTAILTDSAPVPGNTIGTGQIDLATDASTLFSVSNMLPGDVVTKPLTLTNSGAQALRYAATSTTTDNTLAGVLVLEVRTRTSTDPGCTTFDGTALYTGPLGSTTGTKILGDPSLGQQAGDRILSSGITDPLCLRVSLPLGTSNATQNMTTTATLTFVAEQTANNAAYADMVQAAHPVGFWPLNETSGSSASDVSGNGHNGNLYGSLTQGRPSLVRGETAALGFSGGCIFTSYIQPAVTAFSVEAWFATTATSGGVLWADRGINNDWGHSLTLGIGPLGVGYGPGQLSFGVDGANLYVGAGTTAAYNDGKPHHVVATWSAPAGSNVTADQFTIYVDGVAVPVNQNPYTAPTTSPVAGNDGAVIGQETVWHTSYTGDLQDVAVYESVLSPAQVTDHYMVGRLP